MALCVGCAWGQAKLFKQLNGIEGVEHLHIPKFLLNLAAKNGGELDLGENASISGMSDDVIKKLDDVRIFNCEEKEAATKMSKQVGKILSGKGWEPLIAGTDEDGEKFNISQFKKGKKCTIAIFHEGEEETALVVIEGKIDFAQLMEEKDEESEEGKLSLSVKQTAWEEDDEEEEPRKFRDCLIVIDDKVYPNLHTQSEAAKYLYEHNMEWNGIPKMLEGKDVKKKYPDTKKKVAFEYTTTNNNQNI